MANVQELYGKLETGVKMVYDSENWKKFLKVQAMFHNYSFHNTILIWSQCPVATHVAGFNTWKNVGRNVKKGSKAIQIFAPLIGRKREKDGFGNEVDKRGIYGFKVVSVFYITQTEGEELPKVSTTLGGDSKTPLTVEVLQRVIDIPMLYEDIQDGANGYYQPSTHRIVIQKGMGKDQTIRTMIHEYTHSILHRSGDVPRGQAEAEAEGTAYVVASYFGLSTDEYSFGYVAGWANDDEGMETVKKVGSTIQKTAKIIIQKLEKAMNDDVAMGA